MQLIVSIVLLAVLTLGFLLEVWLVSYGLLELPETGALEAVIAHELAHVANRDAMVMTAASVPVVLAEGIRTHLDDDDDPGTFAVVTVPLVVVASATALFGRVVTAGLSRVRERAAEVTGSPAALASALQTLDERIDELPSRSAPTATSNSPTGGSENDCSGCRTSSFEPTHRRRPASSRYERLKMSTGDRRVHPQSLPTLQSSLKRHSGNWTPVVRDQTEPK